MLNFFGGPLPSTSNLGVTAFFWAKSHLGKLLMIDYIYATASAPKHSASLLGFLPKAGKRCEAVAAPVFFSV